MSNIAIAHKDYRVRGGAERVAETMAEGLNSPMYVGHKDNSLGTTKDIEINEIGEDSHWHKILPRGTIPKMVAQMYLWRDHAHNDLSEYDIVITSGAEPLWWTPTDDNQVVLYYLHSTPWYQTHKYNEVTGWVKRSLHQAYRMAYTSQIDTPDLWVANSDVVKRRIVRYLDATPSRVKVVYPPVDTEPLGPDKAETSDYYLIMGRLSSEKEFESVIQTANELQIPLRVAGTGPKEPELKKMAGETVTFEGWVDGKEKHELLSGAKAVINNATTETFGIVPVEAIASGTPVITVNEGAPPQTLKTPEMAIPYERGGLETSIKQFEEEGVEWFEQRMASWADRRFGKERFLSQMRNAITEAQSNATINTE